MTPPRRSEAVAIVGLALAAALLGQTAARDDLTSRAVAAVTLSVAVTAGAALAVWTIRRRTWRIADAIARHPLSLAGDGVPEWHPEGGAGGHRQVLDVAVYAGGHVQVLVFDLAPDEVVRVLRSVADDVESGRAGSAP